MTARGTAVGELLHTVLAALERLERGERDEIRAQLADYLRLTERGAAAAHRAAWLAESMCSLRVRGGR
jgi:hypothetical protein